MTSRDHRAIEEGLADATLLTESLELSGVVIEATFAAGGPPLLKRLREDRIKRIVDPQSLRFVGESFLDVRAFDALPYAPQSPIGAGDIRNAATATGLARGALLYEQHVGTDFYLAPGLPLLDAGLDDWLDGNERILEEACRSSGGASLDRRPVIALVAPGPKALADPNAVVGRLVDYPIAGVYLQPLRLRPTYDSVEKLARVVQFAQALREAGLPVIVGRVGAFGLVLQALGTPVFDSGLGHAEAHDLASLNRPISERERQRRADGATGGPQTRVYFEPLKTTLTSKIAKVLLEDEQLRHRFACRLPCCRFRAIEDFAQRARPHYLWTRQAEVDNLQGVAHPSMKTMQVEAQLREARDLASAAARVLESHDVRVPEFGHLDRWLGLIAREQPSALAA